MAELLAIYRIGATTIEVWSDNVRTILPCGCDVTGQPEGDQTLQDCIDHEVGHTWVAVMLDGLPASPVMLMLGHCGGYSSPEQTALEERRVLDWQLTLRTGEPRPWEVLRL